MTLNFTLRVYYMCTLLDIYMYIYICMYICTYIYTLHYIIIFLLCYVKLCCHLTVSSIMYIYTYVYAYVYIYMCVYVYIVAMTKIAWCLWARGKWVAKIMILLLDLAPWASGWDMANGLRRSWSRDCEVSDIITFCKGVCAHTHTYCIHIYIYTYLYIYISLNVIYIYTPYTPIIIHTIFFQTIKSGARQPLPSPVSRRQWRGMVSCMSPGRCRKYGGGSHGFSPLQYVKCHVKWENPRKTIGKWRFTLW